MRHKITFKRLLLVAAIVFTACGEKADVVYDVPFGQVVAGAQETGERGKFADVAYNIVG